MRGTKKIDWLNHFLEFIVVVIGILIAFQLNTCRENKKEKKIVEKHISNIIEETTFNKDMFKYSLMSLEKLAIEVDKLQAFQQDSNVAVDSLNKQVFNALNLPYLYLQKNAYSSLKGSNDIRFINDFELQNDIIKLYENYAWTESTQTITFTNYSEGFFKYFGENFDLTQNKPQPKEKYITLKFKNIVASYKFSLDQRIRREKSNLKLVEEFLESYKNLR